MKYLKDKTKEVIQTEAIFFLANQLLKVKTQKRPKDYIINNPYIKLNQIK